MDEVNKILKQELKKKITELESKLKKLEKEKVKAVELLKDLKNKLSEIGDDAYLFKK